MTKSLLAIALAIAAIGLVSAGGQTGTATGNDEAGLRAAFESYSAALKTGDLNAIMAFWAADADFTGIDGEVAKGRDAIGKLFVDNLADLKSGKSVIKCDSLRFLTPEVVAAEGSIEFTPAEGPVETNRFSAVWAKKAGKWVIASARDLPESQTQAADRGLKEMQWLAGEWEAKDRDTTVRLTVKSELGGKFAFAKYDVKGPKDSLVVYQMIGWDPTEGTLRSWTFDSRGGFGESLWFREGGTWAGDTVGVLPTGQVGSSMNMIRMMGPNQFKWMATEREVEGLPIPDSELTYNRVNANR